MCTLPVVFLLFCVSLFSVAALNGKGNNAKALNHKFSAAPSGLPTRKVSVMGKQVEVRQMFLEPIRPNGTAKGAGAAKPGKLAPNQPMLGCRLYNQRRRRRKRQGLDPTNGLNHSGPAGGCFGCGNGCGGSGCGCGCWCGGNCCGGCGRGQSCGSQQQQTHQPATYQQQPPPPQQQYLQQLPQPLPTVASPLPPPTAAPALPAPVPAQQYQPLSPGGAFPQLLPGSTLSLTSVGGKVSYKVISPPGGQQQVANSRPPADGWQHLQQGEVSPAQKSSEADSEYSAEEAAAADDLSSVQPPLPPALQKSFDHQNRQQAYQQRPPPPPSSGYAQPKLPPPAGYARPPPPPKPAYVAPKSPFPLPECYVDSSNFMCCNAQLEETMNNAYDSLINANPEFHRCNTQKIATTVQQMAERRFNTSFESVVGLNDYASKSHFFHNYICKIERDNRYIMAYGTPRWDLEGQPEAEELPPAPQPSPEPQQQKGYPISPNPQYINYNTQPNGRRRRVWSNYYHQW